MGPGFPLSFPLAPKEKSKRGKLAQANRSRQIGIRVLSGGDVLRKAHGLAMLLWNYIIDYNKHLLEERSKEPQDGKLRRYPGYFSLTKALTPNEIYRCLALSLIHI